MAQLWVNLPAKDKSAPPRYQALLKEDIPIVSLPDNAGTVRVVAGSFDGHNGPAQTFTPINLWQINLVAGKFVQLLVPDGHTTALLVLKGGILVEGDQRADEGELAVFEREGKDLVFQAIADSHLLLLSGRRSANPS